MNASLLQTPFGRGLLNVVQTALVNLTVDDPDFSREMISMAETIPRIQAMRYVSERKSAQITKM